VIAREKKQERSEADYRGLVENSIDPIVVTVGGRFQTVNRATLDLLGYTREEMADLPVGNAYADPDARTKLLREVTSKGYIKDFPLRLMRKDGSTVEGRVSARMRYGSDGSIAGFEGIFRDVTRQKEMEDKLRKNEKDLKIKSKRLEEANATLKVLLGKVNKESNLLEEQVVTNLKGLIIPILQKLRKSKLSRRQEAYLGVLEDNLYKMLEPFAYNLASGDQRLTPAEIQVAHLIKEGKSSKEIAAILRITQRTVGCHREHIREKLRIKNKSENLRSRLLSLHNADK
jgi:PAS domain S-box-containing protein